MIWFIVTGIGLVIGDVIMNYWADNGSRYQLPWVAAWITALFIYGASLTIWSYQLKETQLGLATIMPILVNIVVIFLVSTLFFHERISIYQAIGVFLALLAFFFIAKG